MAQTITIENNSKLERLLISNPDMEKKVRRIVGQVIKGARLGVEKAASGLSTKQAEQAVRKAVYKKILGGNINIVSGSRRSGSRAPLPAESQRKTSHERGGNRMPRSRRTEDLLTYQGADRGFVLRFLNQGTSSRESGVGYRGAIRARNFFASSSLAAMQKAAEQLDTLIEELIKKELK
jgi:hypothetical protein